jgi:hypothetical protein
MVPLARLRIRVRFSTHAEHSQAIEGISPSGMARHMVRASRVKRRREHTWGEGYLPESERNENHKEDCNYKEEGHVARLIVSVARHCPRGTVQAETLVYRLAAARD